MTETAFESVWKIEETMNSILPSSKPPREVVSQDLLFKEKVGLSRQDGDSIKKNLGTGVQAFVLGILVYLAGFAIWVMSLGFIGSALWSVGLSSPPGAIIFIAFAVGIAYLLIKKGYEILKGLNKNEMKVKKFLSGDINQIATDLGAVLVVPVLQILVKSKADKNRLAQVVRSIFCREWGYSEAYVDFEIQKVLDSVYQPISKIHFAHQLDRVCSKHKDLDSRRVKMQLREILLNLRYELKSNVELTEEAEQLRQHYEVCAQ